MSKYTPGPWEWITKDDGNVMILGTVGKQEFEGGVLLCDKCSACQGTDSRCALPTKADADLIAAAPDLLDALRAMLVCLSEDETRLLLIVANAPGFQKSDRLQNRCNAIGTAFRQARSVIARADGKTSDVLQTTYQEAHGEQ